MGLAGRMGLAFVASMAAIILVNTPIARPDTWIWGVYPLTAGLMVMALMALGAGLKGRPAGVVIDDRNSISLSKLQMITWTVVVVSALVAGGAYNVRNALSAKPAKAVEATAAAQAACTAPGQARPACPAPVPGGPLEIAIPPELLFAMGIAAASFVSTPTILSGKAAQFATQEDLNTARANASPPAAAAAAASGVAAATPRLLSNGKVYTRARSADAQWSDLFMGDEVGNGDTLDLSKIQQFAITLLLVGIYSAQIIQYFHSLAGGGCAGGGCGVFSTLPALGSDFVVLMGISHASYLVYKAAPLTKTGDAPAT